MQPVMLVCGSRLTVIIVVLSLEALLSVVSTARSPGSGATSSPDTHATKSSQRNLTHPIISNSQDKQLGMPEIAGRSGTGAGSRRQQRKNNSTVSSMLPANSQGWTDSGAARGGGGSQVLGASSQRKFDEDVDNLLGTEDIQVGCRELRARSYITDGFCTSEKPVQEVVCAGYCLPIMDMPWYAEFVKTLAKTKLKDWQCVEDVVRKKRVKLLCKDGSSRHYRIKVVKSCKCKKITNKHNKTTHKKKRKRPDEQAKTNVES